MRRRGPELRLTAAAALALALFADAEGGCLPRGGLLPDPGGAGGGSSGGAGMGNGGAGGEPCIDCRASSAGTGGGSGGDAPCALPDPSAPSDCTTACEDIFSCAILVCGGAPLCPGYGDRDGQVDHQTFIVSCLDTCQQLQALISLVDPSQCDATISQLESANADFADGCENGAQGGGGGSGGSGGTGG